MNKDIFERLKKIIGETLPEIDLSNVNESTELKADLGIDSIDMMMIGLVIEDEFDFRFNESMDFVTVSDICDYIEKMI